MSKKISFNAIWHSAGIPGLVLASISTAYFVATNCLSDFTGSWVAVVNFILDALKIYACVALMFTYLKRFKMQYSVNDRADLRRFGTTIALLSALVFSTLQMAYYIWNPELISQTFDTLFEALGPQLDSNAISSLEVIEENFPRMAFFSNFIYCFLFGWVLSAILSSKIITSNPFNDVSEEE